MNQAASADPAAPRSRGGEITSPIDAPWISWETAWAAAVGEGWGLVANWARDCAEAMQGIQTCRSPLDLLAVQQKWLLARNCAWVDAMVRIAGGGLLAPELMAARLSAFHLPE